MLTSVKSPRFTLNHGSRGLSFFSSTTSKSSSRKTDGEIEPAGVLDDGMKVARRLQFQVQFGFNSEILPRRSEGS